MQNNSTDSPAPKKPWWRRALRYSIIGLIWLITLVVLVCVEETWRGRRAWENYKVQLIAKGEKLDWQSIAPALVPDEQNFAQTPFLAPLFDFNKDPNRPPGSSPWRDTNAYHRTTTYTDDLVFPRSNYSWTKSESTDLPGWAAALAKGTSYSEADAAAFTRKQAATEMLHRLEKYKPVLDELRAASKRPYSRFNINYQDNIAMLIPHMAVLKPISRIYALQASAELALDQNEQALADVRMVLYLGDSIKTEPFLISKLVRVALLQQAYQPVWEGLQEHKWSEAQLAELQQMFSNYNFIAETADALRGERALFNGAMDQIRTDRKVGYMQAISNSGRSDDAHAAVLYLTPGAIFYWNQLKISQIFQEVILPIVTPAERRVHPELGTDQKMEEKVREGFYPYRFLAQQLLPAISKATMKMAHAQSTADEAALACALERYRLAHHQLPASLDELKPQFITQIPSDVFSGEPIKYRRIDETHFVLYSIGWNQKDDGGVTAMSKGSTPNIELKEGDWVWPQYHSR
ncbi:MAG: hypothetical protein JWQ71_3993 [Pedosphaera sp.]|nr:hypothetical protein [Pedosphaera sp.]